MNAFELITSRLAMHMFFQVNSGVEHENNMGI